ncbi:MAG TPA: hypothetical protein VIL99_15725 [Ignavibacteria bacterium]
MGKKLLFLLLFTIFYGFTYCQINIDANDLRNLIIKGKIQELTVLTASQINTPSENNEIEFQYSFDTIGNITAKKSFYNGMVIQNEIFFYDYKGNMTKEQWFNPDNSEIFSSYTRYEYNIRGMVGIKNVYNSDSSIRKSLLYSYDEKGYLTQIHVKEYYDEGDEYSEIFNYDEKGKFINHQIVDLNGVQILYENFIYDEKGNIIELLSSGEEINRKLNYEYDLNGNLSKYILESSDDEGKSLTEGIYNYDNKGNLIEEILYDNKNYPTEKRKFEYIY